MSFWKALFRFGKGATTAESTAVRSLEDWTDKAAADSESLMQYASKLGYTITRKMKKNESEQTVNFWHELKLARQGKTDLGRVVQITSSTNGVVYTILPGNDSRDIKTFADVRTYLQIKKNESVGAAA